MNKNIPPKNLLFITRSYPPTRGGMEEYAFNLHHSLSKLMECKLVSNTKSYSHIPILAIKAMYTSIAHGWKYDAFYCNDMLTSFFIIPAKLIYKKRLVTTIYGLDINYIHSKPRSITNWLTIKIYTFIIKLTCYFIDDFVAISQGTANLGKKIGINHCKIITPGINPNNENDILSQREIARKSITAKFNIAENTKIISHVGRGVKRKGLVWFISEVFENLPINYHVIIVGSGPETLASIDIVRERGIEESFSFITNASDELRDSILLASDLFIMPNINIQGEWEGFGMVAIEASAKGTPVVASRTEGITSAVIENKTGLFFEPEDADDCIRKINLCNSQHFSHTLVSEITIHEFNWNSIAMKFMNVFST